MQNEKVKIHNFTKDAHPWDHQIWHLFFFEKIIRLKLIFINSAEYLQNLNVTCWLKVDTAPNKFFPI